MQLRKPDLSRFAFPTVLLFLIGASTGLAAPLALETPPSAAPSNSIGTVVSFVKDVVNILFFVVIAALGVLSYLQARKTLFAPIRTETFKYQLKLFEEVLLFFQVDYESDTGMQFDFLRILNLNAQLLLEQYAKWFFGDEVKFDEAKREARRKELVGAIVKANHVVNITEPLLLYKKQKQAELTERPTNPAVLLAQWQKYEYPGVQYTAKFSEQTEKLRLLRASPLMPKGLRELIQQFEKTVHQNLTAIGDILTEIAKELPAKYPTAQAISKTDFIWIWNRYNTKREDLDKLKEDILRYVGEYLRVDAIHG